MLCIFDEKVVGTYTATLQVNEMKLYNTCISSGVYIPDGDVL